jgi:hypothetical protein
MVNRLFSTCSANHRWRFLFFLGVTFVLVLEAKRVFSQIYQPFYDLAFKNLKIHLKKRLENFKTLGPMRLEMAWRCLANST